MTKKIFGIGVVAVVCLLASSLVLGLVVERENSYNEAKRDIGNTWGEVQTLIGPMLIFTLPPKEDSGYVPYEYVLPKKLTITSTIDPEIRSRGIYDTVVYTERIQVEGVFSFNDMQLESTDKKPVFAVSITDTRSIEKQVSLNWGKEVIDLEPGANTKIFNPSGIHTYVPLSYSQTEYPFSFEITIKGSDRAMFAPLGKETTVTAFSPWESPEFVGAYLPTERSMDSTGFSATWNISSFGRNYPQKWTTDEAFLTDAVYSSAFGVGLYEGVDMYTQVFRSVRYAVLFILITFTAFFLFDILKKIRIHPIQYLLVGSALALFYLLLLPLTEHLGFLVAYILATVMTTGLITTYSVSVLKQKSHASLVFILLITLYAYLYFVLKLEDFALLFGSLLVFVLLGSVMYLTRKIDWYAPSQTGK